MPRSIATLLTFDSRTAGYDGVRCNSPAVIGSRSTLNDRLVEDGNISDRKNDECCGHSSSSAETLVPLIIRMRVHDISDGEFICRTAMQLPSDVIRTATNTDANESRDHVTRANTTQDDRRKDGRYKKDRKLIPGSDKSTCGNEPTINGASFSALVLSSSVMGSRLRSPVPSKDARCNGWNSGNLQLQPSSNPAFDQGNRILRIHSLDSCSSESYQNLRSALLQIRDSLSSTATVATGTPSSDATNAVKCPVGRGQERNGHRTLDVDACLPINHADNCVDRETDTLSNKSSYTVLSRRSSAVALGTAKRITRNGVARPERPFLPSTPPPLVRLNASLTSDGEDEESAAERKKIRRRLMSRRHRSSVKFADDFGLNLNTFVMIPSRSRSKTETRRSPMSLGPRGVTTYVPPPACRPAVVAAPAVDARVGRVDIVDREERFSPINYLKCIDEGDHELIRACGDSKMEHACSLSLRRSCSHPPTAAIDHSGSSTPPHSAEVFVDGQSTRGSGQTASDECPLSSLAVNGAPVPVDGVQQFRLNFDQPFANQEQFTSRLGSQMVCLENVRVEDWSPGGGAASSSTSPPLVVAANSVMLCTIRVRNVHPEKRVFARCTDNDWATFADLPAHHVGGIDSLGYEHDRFCFAVRRPLYGAAESRGDVDETPARRPAAAVEFAVCFQAAGKTYWDNNAGSNYRIEWS